MELYCKWLTLISFLLEKEMWIPNFYSWCNCTLITKYGNQLIHLSHPSNLYLGCHTGARVRKEEASVLGLNDFSCRQKKKNYFASQLKYFFGSALQKNEVETGPKILFSIKCWLQRLDDNFAVVTVNLGYCFTSFWCCMYSSLAPGVETLRSNLISINLDLTPAQAVHSPRVCWGTCCNKIGYRQTYRRSPWKSQKKFCWQMSAGAEDTSK